MLQIRLIHAVPDYYAIMYIHILPSQVTLCEVLESCFCDTHFEVSMVLNDSLL